MQLTRREALIVMSSALAVLGRPAFAQVQIDYWNHFTSQSEFTGLQKLIEMFQASKPEFSIRPQSISNSAYMAKVADALLAGTLPDTAMVTSDRFADMMGMGILTDISARLKNWAGFNDLSPEGLSPFTRDGRTYAVPAFAFVDWMYYRSDLFAGAGIEEAPRTLDELVSAGRKLTKPDEGKYGFSLRGGTGGYKYVIDLMEAFGSPILSGNQPAIDKKAAAEAIRFYSGLLLKEKIVPPTAATDSFRQTIDAFCRGQTAMVWHHTGSLKDVSERLRPGSEFATALIPAGPSARVARVAYAANAVLKEDTGAAWEWVSFCGGKDATLALLRETGYFPANGTAVTDPLIRDNLLYRTAAETIGIARRPVTFAGFSGWCQNVVDPAFQSVLTGETSPEKAVDQIVAGLEKAMK